MKNILGPRVIPEERSLWLFFVWRLFWLFLRLRDLRSSDLDLGRLYQHIFQKEEYEHLLRVFAVDKRYRGCLKCKWKWRGIKRKEQYAFSRSLFIWDRYVATWRIALPPPPPPPWAGCRLPLSCLSGTGIYIYIAGWREALKILEMLPCESWGAFHFYSPTSRTNRDKLMKNGTTFPD